jgi:hypothetical protein
MHYAVPVWYGNAGVALHPHSFPGLCSIAKVV